MGATAVPMEIEHRECIVLFATTRGNLAERNLMLPLFAKNVLENRDDMQRAIRKTFKDMKDRAPEQIPVMQSTMSQRLSLRELLSLRKSVACRPAIPRKMVEETEQEGDRQ